MSTTNFSYVFADVVMRSQEAGGPEMAALGEFM